MSDLEKINKGEITKLLRNLKKQPDSHNEQKILQQLIDLYEQESQLKKQIKQETNALDAALLQKLSELNPTQVQQLLIEQKWFADLQKMLDQEISSTMQKLEQSIIDLEERYQQPLPELESQVQFQEQKVQQHLKEMGFSW